MKVRCFCDIMDGAPPSEHSLCVTVEATAKAYGGLFPLMVGCTRYWFTVDLPVAEAKEKELGIVTAERER